MKTILVAIDGSNHAHRAVELAADIAAKYGAKLLLLHIIENRALTESERRLAEAEYSEQIKRGIKGSDAVDMRATELMGVEPFFTHHAETGIAIRTALGEGLLKSARNDAEATGVKEIETILENGDPAKAILSVAKKRNANLIVIGSRGQSDVKALFLGSVSHKVSNLAEVNVITVK